MQTLDLPQQVSLQLNFQIAKNNISLFFGQTGNVFCIDVEVLGIIISAIDRLKFLHLKRPDSVVIIRKKKTQSRKIRIGLISSKNNHKK